MIINFNNLGGGGGSYTLPAATTSSLGGVIVGSGLTVDSGGTLSVSGGSSGPEVVLLNKLTEQERLDLYSAITECYDYNTDSFTSAWTEDRYSFFIDLRDHSEQEDYSVADQFEGFFPMQVTRCHPTDYGGAVFFAGIESSRNANGNIINIRYVIASDGTFDKGTWWNSPSAPTYQYNLRITSGGTIADDQDWGPVSDPNNASRLVMQYYEQTPNGDIHAEGKVKWVNMVHFDLVGVPEWAWVWGADIQIGETIYTGVWRMFQDNWSSSSDIPPQTLSWRRAGDDYYLDEMTTDETIALYNYLYATVGEHTENYRGNDRFFRTVVNSSVSSRVQLTLAGHLYNNGVYQYVFSAVAQSVSNSQLYQTAYAIGENGARGNKVNTAIQLSSIGNDKYVLVSDSAGTVTSINEQITGNNVYNQVCLLWLSGNTVYGKGKLDYFDIRWETISDEQVPVFYIGGWCPVDGTIYRGTWHWVYGQWPSAQSPLAPDTWEPVYDALREPDVIYQTDGTTGLLGHNQNAVTGNWQIENLDLTPYAYVKCYFACGTATGDSRTPAVVVTVPLDAASIGPDGYIGSAMAALPFNRNGVYTVSCAVDSTKTKFQVIHQNTLWDITANDANSAGRYCYKIEGWYN